MNTDESKAWEMFIDEGTKYLKTAVNGAAKRKDVFTPEILYNIAAMSVETTGKNSGDMVRWQ